VGCNCEYNSNPPSGLFTIRNASGMFSWMGDKDVNLVKVSGYYNVVPSFTNEYVGVFAGENDGYSNDIFPTGYNDRYIVPAWKADTSCSPFWLTQLTCVSGIQALNITNNTINKLVGNNTSTAPAIVYDNGYFFHNISGFDCGNNFHAYFNQDGLTGTVPQKIDYSGTVDFSITNSNQGKILHPSSHYSDLILYNVDLTSAFTIPYNTNTSGYFIDSGHFKLISDPNYYVSEQINYINGTGYFLKTNLIFDNIPKRPSHFLAPYNFEGGSDLYPNRYAEWRMVDSGNNETILYSPFQTDLSSRPWPVNGRPDIYLTSLNYPDSFFISNRAPGFGDIPMRFVNQFEDCNYPVSGLYCRLNGVDYNFTGTFLRYNGLSYQFKKTFTQLTGTGGATIDRYSIVCITFGPFCKKYIRISVFSQGIYTCGGVSSQLGSAGGNFFIIDDTKQIENLSTFYDNISGYFTQCDPFYFSLSSKPGIYPNISNPTLYAWGNSTPFATGVCGIWGCSNIYDCKDSNPNCNYYSMKSLIDGTNNAISVSGNGTSATSTFVSDGTCNFSGGGAATIYYDVVNQYDLEVHL